MNWKKILFLILFYSDLALFYIVHIQTYMCKNTLHSTL